MANVRNRIIEFKNTQWTLKLKSLSIKDNISRQFFTPKEEADLLAETFENLARKTTQTVNYYLSQQYIISNKLFHKILFTPNEIK